MYQNLNRIVGHQTNTCNARLLHVILGIIFLLLHAKIYNAVDYYESTNKVYLLHTTPLEFLPTS